jgi:hypothetical protein
MGKSRKEAKEEFLKYMTHAEERKHSPGRLRGEALGERLQEVEWRVNQSLNEWTTLTWSECELFSYITNCE